MGTCRSGPARGPARHPGRRRLRLRRRTSVPAGAGARSVLGGKHGPGGKYRTASGLGGKYAQALVRVLKNCTTAYVNLQNETWIFKSINLRIAALEVDNNLAKEHGKQIQQVLTEELHSLLRYCDWNSRLPSSAGRSQKSNNSRKAPKF